MDDVHGARFPARSATSRAALPVAWSPAAGGVLDIFTVRPVADGWRVQGGDLEEVVFASGGDAERQARRLALSVGRLGRDAKVNVYDASDILVGEINYFGCETSPQPEARCRYPWAQ